jgi:hypothetical protein
VPSNHTSVQVRPTTRRNRTMDQRLKPQRTQVDRHSGPSPNSQTRSIWPFRLQHQPRTPRPCPARFWFSPPFSKLTSSRLTVDHSPIGRAAIARIGGLPTLLPRQEAAEPQIGNTLRRRKRAIPSYHGRHCSCSLPIPRCKDYDYDTRRRTSQREREPLLRPNRFALEN